MKRFVFFTDEELKVIISALCRTMDDYERGVLINETEYKMAKKLYLEIRQILYIDRMFNQI